MFVRFRALVTEPTAYRYAERHDNIEAIYKKLTERRDTADVTELLKALHRIVNEAISTRAPGQDQAAGVTFDLSQLDLDKLRAEFAKRVQRKVFGGVLRVRTGTMRACFIKEILKSCTQMRFRHRDRVVFFEGPMQEREGERAVRTAKQSYSRMLREPLRFAEIPSSFHQMDEVGSSPDSIQPGP